MKFPIDNKILSDDSQCFVCSKKISGAPIILSVDALRWLPGLVSQKQVSDPDILPSPAPMPQIVTGEFRLRLLDASNEHANRRYLSIISSYNAEVRFCSTTCVRGFFKAIVDAFEQSYISR